MMVTINIKVVEYFIFHLNENMTGDCSIVFISRKDVVVWQSSDNYILFFPS